jgi:hypothetical protein
MSGLAQAQAPEHSRNGERPMMTPQIRAERMAKELNLTDAEKSKVQALFEKENADRKSNQAEVQKTKEELKTDFEKQRKANNAELENIIGKEKYQKYVNLRQERMKERREKMMNDSISHEKK